MLVHPSHKQIRPAMEKSKIALQQNAVLLYLDTMVNEFGSSSLDVKSVLTYALGPMVALASLSHQ